MKLLNIGKAASSSGGDSHADHDHRRRRSAGAVSLPSWGSRSPHAVHRRAVDNHGHETNGHTGSVSNNLLLINQLINHNIFIMAYCLFYTLM